MIPTGSRTTGWRLACLWLGQALFVFAASCLGWSAARQGLVHGVRLAHGLDRTQAWYVMVLTVLLPGIVLAPVLAALASRCSRRGLLLLAAYLGVLTALADGLTAKFELARLAAVLWPALLGLLAAAAAVHGVARDGLLPEAARDGHFSLPRVLGLFGMATAWAAAPGNQLATDWHGMAPGNVPLLPLLCGSGSVLALMAYLPARFVEDAVKPVPFFEGLRGFFKESGRICTSKDMRGCLVGMATLRGLLGAVVGTWAADYYRQSPALVLVGTYLAFGLGGGALLTCLQRHPRRVQALVPIGATGCTVCLILLALGVAGETLLLVSMSLGVFVSLVHVPLNASYLEAVPAAARAHAVALRGCVCQGMALLLGGGFFASFFLLGGGWKGPAPLWLLAGVASALTLVTWRWLLREVLEQTLELLLLPLYHITANRPGLAEFPRRGPVLVVANHSAWLDPAWLGKVLPRRLIPMMTSIYYDLPGLHWLMARVFRTIRVEVGHFRREVPELEQAVAALDRGETVLVFPEGAMRRREEMPLRHFGQGSWRILQERPTTPVVICWIEGGWGSFFSYFLDRPAKGKRLDFFRPIRIGVSMPRVLPLEVLTDHRATRAYLMQECLDARKHLGLEPLTVAEENKDPNDQEP